MFSAKVKNVWVCPLSDQYLCYAVVERPELAKVLYKGPARNVMLLITNDTPLQFSHSKEPQTTIYKGATIPLIPVDSFAPIKKPEFPNPQHKINSEIYIDSADRWD